jgi:hypothetical protein
MTNMTYSFPPVDDALALAQKVDWRRVAYNIVMTLVTITAVIIAVVQWSIKTYRQWQADHGEEFAMSFTQYCGKLINAIDTIANWNLEYVADAPEPVATPAKVPRTRTRKQQLK